MTFTESTTSVLIVGAVSIASSGIFWASKILTIGGEIIGSIRVRTCIPLYIFNIVVVGVNCKTDDIAFALLG
jgi:hypothetical protein